MTSLQIHCSYPFRREKKEGNRGLPEILTIAAGFPSVMISSGVATLELRKPVSSNRPSCCILPAEKSGAGLSRDKGDTMLSRLLFVVHGLSADDGFLWADPQDGVIMLSLNVSAVEGLRSTKVGLGDTRLISTVSAKEILRSVQEGREGMPGLMTLTLLSWHFSTSSVFGVGVEYSRLLVSAE